ncbi:alkaline phosphatase family protein [Thiomicrorhabdus sp.]|uniref:alkaline phosphatase family protein n=1 Tax=Thiomicrorhabdus sp. TaxID=2039724 RepID=UPI0029C90327|nr:alkaline phosphatase family protein [Thiomicrorhabdus sp.]
MKILIFGIDGLGETALDALGLKRLAARISSGQIANPEIQNVISRGWPELYTGKDAYESGGFYQVPVLKNGKIFPSQNTGLSVIKKIIGEDNLLWNKLNKMGYKVGLFTIPTVSKPEKIDGFCVAATGAGKFGNDVTEDDLFPKSLLDGLHIKDIDLGFRMGYGAYMPESIEDLEVNANKHLADYFYTLNRVLDKNNVDVCFAASRFVNEMGYKFLGVCLSEPDNEFDKELKSTVLALCESFDKQLDDLINKFQPEHLFVVSDHGMKKYEFDLNLNQFLLENGFIKKDRSSKTLLKQVVKQVVSIFNPKRFGPVSPKYQFNSGRFFSIGYMNALYLNDSRFGGESLSDDEAYSESLAFSKELNDLLQKKGLSQYIEFSAIKSKPSVGEGNDKVFIPNIVCNMVDGLNNSERNDSVLEKRSFDFSRMFSHGFFGEHSGCKSEDTLSAYVGHSIRDVNQARLTSIYDSIISVAKKEKEGEKL